MTITNHPSTDPDERYYASAPALGDDAIVVARDKGDAARAVAAQRLAKRTIAPK
jgi:hypothetical protein